MNPVPREPQEAITVGAPAARQVPVKWSNADVPVHFANIAWGIVDDLGDIVITLGRVEPPPIGATEPDDRRRELEALDHVDGHVLFRFSTSPERLKVMTDQIATAIEMRKNWRRDVLKSDGA